MHIVAKHNGGNNAKSCKTEWKREQNNNANKDEKCNKHNEIKWKTARTEKHNIIFYFVNKI